MDYCSNNFILSIETSCDDTSIAVLLSKTGKVVLQEHCSQISHSTFGGVVPEIASREHAILLQKLFDKISAKINIKQIIAVAVTKGPGLIGSLLCGVSFAKGVSVALSIPLIGVNHLHGHLMSASYAENLKYPLLFLLVSGGHTQIAIAHSLEQYELITETLDDAVGEVFDKIAKYLGLGYPGGPIVEKLAELGEIEILTKANIIDEFCIHSVRQKRIYDTNDKKFLHSFYNDFFHHYNKFSFKVAIENDNRLDLSFSGLKTQIKNFIQQQKEINQLTDKLMQQICYEAQKTIIKTLINKLFITIKDFLIRTKDKRLNKQLIVCGGVASNKKLKEALQSITHAFRIDLVYPPRELAMDNAIMIGKMAVEKFRRHMFDKLDMKINSTMNISEL